MITSGIASLPPSLRKAAETGVAASRVCTRCGGDYEVIEVKFKPDGIWADRCPQHPETPSRVLVTIKPLTAERGGYASAGLAIARHAGGVYRRRCCGLKGCAERWTTIEVRKDLTMTDDVTLCAFCRSPQTRRYDPDKLQPEVDVAGVTRLKGKKR